jgi:hypothetical protein
MVGRGYWLPVAQGGIAVLLLIGVAPSVTLPVLWLLGVMHLWRYQGPYNGGADKMLFLTLTCLSVARLSPDPIWADVGMAYLAVQLLLSYVQSGWIKIVNPDWRDGTALRRVFAVSVYPVSEGLRGWARWPRLLRAMSWGVMGFELAMPLGLLNPFALIVALSVAACFHLANAMLFGLNRFVWAWIAAYPSLIWLQERLMAALA